MHERTLETQASFSKFSFDELDAACDLLKEWLGYPVQKRGKPSIQSRINASINLRELHNTISEESFDQEDLLMLLQSLTLMRSALAPRPYRRGGEGYVQVKHIKGFPYAYFRTWVTGGDWDRQKKILRSKCLGRILGEGMVAGLITEDEVVAAFHAEEIDSLKERIHKQLGEIPHSWVSTPST